MITVKRFKLKSLIDFGGQYIYHDNHENSMYNRICSKHMDTTMRRFIIKMLTINVSFFIGAAGIFYTYFVHGIISTILEIRIPFCEPKSDAEFIVKLVLQILIGGHGLIMYFGIEMYFSMFENIVTIAPKLIKIDLKHTIQMYEEGSIAELELRRRIRNIVKLCSDSDK